MFSFEGMPRSTGNQDMTKMRIPIKVNEQKMWCSVNKGPWWPNRCAPQDTQSRRYSTMSCLSRRRLSMHAEFISNSDALNPPGFAPEARRRSSPTTYRRTSLTPTDARQYPLIHPTELPPSPMPSPRIRSKSGNSRAELNYSQSRGESDIPGGRRHSTKEG
jgi:hypothetical protein